MNAFQPTGLTVLLVEDDPSNREGLGDVLRCSGFRVVAAEDGAQALGIVGQVRFDVVLTDFHLPDMRGTELLDQIHSRSGLPRKAAVMVSGVEPLRGAFAYLRKPCELDVLVSVLWDRAAVGREHRRRTGSA